MKKLPSVLTFRLCEYAYSHSRSYWIIVKVTKFDTITWFHQSDRNTRRLTKLLKAKAEAKVADKAPKLHSLRVLISKNVLYCLTVRKRERERERETHKSSVTRTLTEKLPHRIKASKHPKSWSTSIDPFKLDFYGKSNGCFQIEIYLRISLIEVIMPIMSRASNFNPQNTNVFL